MQSDLTPAELTELFGLLAPGWPLRRLPELFENRAPLGSVKAWRYGHVRMPAWAVECLKIRAERALAIASRQKKGPGKQAGTENIRKWHARKKD